MAAATRPMPPSANTRSTRNLPPTMLPISMPRLVRLKPTPLGGSGHLSFSRPPQDEKENNKMADPRGHGARRYREFPYYRFQGSRFKTDSSDEYRILTRRARQQRGGAPDVTSGPCANLCAF